MPHTHINLTSRHKRLALKAKLHCDCESTFLQTTILHAFRPVKKGIITQQEENKKSTVELHVRAHLAVKPNLTSCPSTFDIRLIRKKKD